MWRNWAGDQSCRPAEVIRPRSRDELVEAVGSSAAAGKRIKVAGSGHSFTEAPLTDGTMIRLEELDRVLDADPATGLVKVEAGIVLGALNAALARHGLALPNLGDIDRQTWPARSAPAPTGPVPSCATSRPRWRQSRSSPPTASCVS